MDVSGRKEMKISLKKTQASSTVHAKRINSRQNCIEPTQPTHKAISINNNNTINNNLSRSLYAHFIVSMGPLLMYHW